MLGPTAAMLGPPSSLQAAAVPGAPAAAAQGGHAARSGAWRRRAAALQAAEAEAEGRCRSRSSSPATPSSRSLSQSRNPSASPLLRLRHRRSQPPETYSRRLASYHGEPGGALGVGLRSEGEEGLLEAILERKKSPNRLVVDEATNDDNSVVALHPDTMERLQLFHSDTVLLKVGKDVVSCLMLQWRGGHEMRVCALVNDTVGTLPGACSWDHDMIAAVILATGTNACYIEQTEAIPKLQHLHLGAGKTIISTKWGALSGDLPLTEFDRDMDAESINPGEPIYEKTTSGMHLGEIVRRVLLKIAKVSNHFGLSFPEKFSEPFVLRLAGAGTVGILQDGEGFGGTDLSTNKGGCY